MKTITVLASVLLSTNAASIDNVIKNKVNVKSRKITNNKIAFTQNNVNTISTISNDTATVRVSKDGHLIHECGDFDSTHPHLGELK